MESSSERKDKEIKPYAGRLPCPFYGFSAMYASVLKDSGGNQCALEIIPYGPCEMELAGNKPGWSECAFNTEENRKKRVGNLDKTRVFPREFRPSEGKSWDGWPLRIWMRHIEDMAIEE